MKWLNIRQKATVTNDLKTAMRESVEHVGQMRLPTVTVAEPEIPPPEPEPEKPRSWKEIFKGCYRDEEDTAVDQLPHMNVEDDGIEIEIDRYLSRPTLHHEADPLLFWEENASTYPKV